MITYFDTSILMKLVIDDEAYRPESERLWLDSDYVVCAEIGYVEARAALAAARRHERLDAAALQTAKNQLELLWEQVSIVLVDTALVQVMSPSATPFVAMTPCIWRRPSPGTPQWWRAPIGSWSRQPAAKASASRSPCRSPLTALEDPWRHATGASMGLGSPD